MLSEKIKQLLKKQHYEIVGNHSAVQICRWAKKSIRKEGVCYKEKFYGIKSHQCCQMTPSLWCQNKCLHCWRAIEHFTDDKIKGKINNPKEIIDGCIDAQKKLLEGFKIKKETAYKTKSKADMKKWEEAQEPMQFAISLSGEPTLYPYVGELIKELRKRGKTSFLVTNGLCPERLKELKEKNQLPTQLYISVNASNKKLYNKFHRSLEKNSWEKLNKSLDLIKDIKCRTVVRINLVKDLNMDCSMIQEYVRLIKKASPLFIEVKGFMSVGFARQRLRYDKMPTYGEIIDFSKKLIKKLGKDWRILGWHEFSRVVLIGRQKDKLKMKIKEEEI